MELITIAGTVMLCYTLLYFIDKNLKARNSIKYANFLQKFPLQIDFMNVRVSTTLFNRVLSRPAARFGNFFRAWYSLGATLTIIAILPALILLISTAFTSIQNLRHGIREDAVLQPVLPGVNLPKSEMIYYFTTLLICTVIHEMGHAIAAVGEQVPLAGVGLILFLVLPAAFVELPTSNVNALPPWKQLKIYCAGIWHNLMLSFAAYAGLLILPFMVIPFFKSGDGVYLYEFNQYSTGGPHDFQLGDLLTSIGGCQLTDTSTWNRCLTLALREPQEGFCLNESLLPPHQSKSLNSCCPEDDTNLQSHLCFSSTSNHFCMRAREVQISSTGPCYNPEECPKLSSICLIPSLVNESLSNRLLSIHRRDGEPVLFLGHPSELYLSLDVSDYAPRIPLFSPRLIKVIEKLLSYVISFSAGLAVLNVIPCMAMDGQHIVTALSEMISVPKTMSSMVKKRILDGIIYFGTGLIVINVFAGVISLFS